MSEEDKGRFIDVWWDDERSTSYIANLQVEAPDRDGVLLEITNILSALKIPFKSVNAYVNKKGIAIIQIGVENQKHLRSCTSKKENSSNSRCYICNKITELIIY